jgi:nitrite reductase/ring-hydroxylating ferredoxin subunit
VPTRAGSLEELRDTGRLLTKVGNLPVVVFWSEDRAWAIEDRCPHMGFPLHQGTVESGLVTCHWHHARFDLVTGCTLDPFADDARGFLVTLDGDDVLVEARRGGDPVEQLFARLDDGLELGLSLVLAKSVLGLLEAGIAPEEIVRRGIAFGTRYRDSGWGAGLTVLVAMANVLPSLALDDRALALVHGLAFVARDTRNHPPRFPMRAFDAFSEAGRAEHEPARLASWYRRFVETRSADAAELVLTTALAEPAALGDAERMMFAAVTDHVFVDGGHTIDFTNKAFESLGYVGRHAAADVLPTLVRGTASASWSEQSGTWRHPHDLAALVASMQPRLDAAIDAGATRRGAYTDVSGLAWQLLDDDPERGPERVVDALLDALTAGADPEQLGRALAYAAALRITRFHVQNDFGDWDTVHHAFTAAHALHAALTRLPTPELQRGLVHGALRVHLDRFLNVPAARLPDATTGDLADLDECWEIQGAVDRAGAVAAGFLRGGGDPDQLVAALGHALLREDAEFHWYQVFEAAVAEHHAWPTGSEEGVLILAGLARFLAAHTPTRRELSRVVDVATRLRRGEELFAAD